MNSGKDFDRRVVGRHQPDIDHVGVGHGDTAIGPVLGPIIGLGIGRRIGLAVNHDRSTRIRSLESCLAPIVGVGVGNVYRQEKIAVGVAHIEQVTAFGCFEIALHTLVALGTYTQGDLEGPENFAVVQEMEFAVRLDDQDFVGRRKLIRERDSWRQYGQQNYRWP